MTQRRGNGELVEVGLSRKYRPPVGHIADGGKGIATDLLELERIGEGDGVDPDADEHEEQRRQEAAGPTRPEGGEGDGAAGTPLQEEEAGDEVAAEDAEEIGRASWRE